MNLVVAGCVILLVFVVTTLIIMADLSNDEKNFNTEVLKCMYVSGTRLYVAVKESTAWSEQLEQFSPVSLEDLAIDCSITENSRKACNASNITGVTWMIKGEVVRGVQSPKTLWRLANCANISVSQT